MDTKSKTTLAGEVSHIGKMELGAEVADTTRDLPFKSLFKFKQVAATLIHLTLDEFRNDSVRDIIDWINSGEDTRGMTIEEKAQSEIALSASEDGDAGEKSIRYDLVFSVNKPNSGESIVKFTIDLEMERGNNSNKPYDIVQRGIYYAASLLRGTVPVYNKYQSIHKVYSIWLCMHPIQIDGTGTGARGKFDFSKEFVHHYSINRCYKNLGVTMKDPRADLMEVVFIELSKMQESESYPEVKEFLSSVFMESDSDRFSRVLEEVSGIRVPVIIKKEAFTVISKEAYGELRYKDGEEVGEMKGLEKGLEKGIQKGKLEGQIQLVATTIKNLSTTSTKSEACQMAKTISGCSDFIIESALKYLEVGNFDFLELTEA